VLERFQDAGKQGGFYLTADDHENLIQRPKPIFDDILPAGNAIAVQVLIKLGHLSNSIRALVAAERALKNAWPSLDRNPAGCAAMLLALEEYYYPSRIVVIRGPAADIEIWRQQCTQVYAPRCLILAIPESVSGLPQFLAQCTPQQQTVAYICSGSRCSTPVQDLAELERMLSKPEQTPPQPARPVATGRSVH
jgi:uncharacterized protein YyaL (SSP411 family)